MKYIGTIIGLRSTSGSIYNVVTDDTKCYVWKANVVAELNGNMLNIAFNWNGELYEMKLSLLKENYYTGKIYYNNEIGGNAFLWSYKQNEALLLKGDFEEDDAGNYDCFVELKLV